MSNFSQTEENYLKAIYKLQEKDNKSVSTNALAQLLNTSAASVTDMLKKLAEKALIVYEKYYGVTLTNNGLIAAKILVRKHRLWEVFLVEKLKFGWDEVHEIAEELEHIQSEKLIKKLDKFLNFPRFDPHGDPIPDANGNFSNSNYLNLTELKIKDQATLVGVGDDSTSFLQHLDQLGLSLGVNILIQDIRSYDDSILMKVNKVSGVVVSEKVAKNIYIKVKQ